MSRRLMSRSPTGCHSNVLKAKCIELKDADFAHSGLKGAQQITDSF